MSKLLVRLESGRASVASLAIVILLLAGALFVQDSGLRASLFLLAAVLFAVLLIAQIGWSKRTSSKINSRLNTVDRKIGDASTQTRQTMESNLARAVKNIEQSKDYSIVLNAIERLEVSLGERGAAPSVETIPSKNRYSPSLITPSNVMDRPNAHLAGRQAAELTTDESSRKKLQLLLKPGGLEPLPSMAVISTDTFAGVISDLGEATRLVPGLSKDMIPVDASYFIIEEAAFSEGIWAGGLSTQRTDLQLELLATIQEVRKRGVIVVVVESVIPHHFTDTLRKNADVTIAKKINSAPGSQAELLPICIELSKRYEAK